jgi:hypothetical protein
MALEPEVSSHHSQDPTTGPYPEPVESAPTPQKISDKKNSMEQWILFYFTSLTLCAIL